MSEKNLKGTSTDLSGDAVEEISSNLRRRRFVRSAISRAISGSKTTIKKA